MWLLKLTCYVTSNIFIMPPNIHSILLKVNFKKTQETYSFVLWVPGEDFRAEGATEQNLSCLPFCFQECQSENILVQTAKFGSPLVSGSKKGEGMAGGESTLSPRADLSFQVFP